MRRAILVALVVSAAVAGCRSPHYADRGAALGGLAGAVTGAVIGDRNGNAAAGAIVGTAVGAITGAAIGQSIDEDLAHSRAVVQARMGRQISGAVTEADVVAMVQAGVSDDVILTHVRANGVARRPATSDVIRMTQQGVSEGVIIAMQQTPLPSVQPPVIVRSPPVIVREHCYEPPWYPPYIRPHHYHARGPYHYDHGHRRSARLGISFH